MIEHIKEKREPTLGCNERRNLARNLRLLYGKSEAAPLPDRFRALLQELDEKESGARGPASELPIKLAKPRQ